MPVRPPSLRAIAAFEAAARHQSFSKAAEELNLTRSAISHAIRSVELRLGVELFTRQGPNVRLTEPGRAFASRLRASLDMISQAFEMPASQDHAVLRIGAAANVMHRAIAPRLSDLRSERPDLDFELRARGGPSDLISGLLDVVIVQGSSAPTGFASRLLARESLVAVASPALFPRTPVAAEELLEAALIHQLDRPWRLWFEAAGVEPAACAEAMRVDDPTVAIELARAGAGVCLAPRLLVLDDLRARRLVRLSDAEVYLPEGYWAVWSPTSAKGDLIKAFIDWLSAALGSGRTLGLHRPPGRAA